MASRARSRSRSRSRSHSHASSEGSYNRPYSQSRSRSRSASPSKINELALRVNPWIKTKFIREHSEEIYYQFESQIEDAIREYIGDKNRGELQQMEDDLNVRSLANTIYNDIYEAITEKVLSMGGKRKQRTHKRKHVRRCTKRKGLFRKKSTKSI